MATDITFHKEPQLFVNRFHRFKFPHAHQHSISARNLLLNNSVAGRRVVMKVQNLRRNGDWWWLRKSIDGFERFCNGPARP